MYLNDLKTKGLWKCRVSLGEAWDGDEAETWDGIWIDLREPKGDELPRLNDQQSTMDVVLGCIVDHNIETEPGKKAKTEDVRALVRDSSTLIVHIVKEYMTSLPLARRSEKSSDK